MKMKTRNVVLALAIAMPFSGCASIEGSSKGMLSDERIKAETSAVLGYQPQDLTIDSRRAQGLNTYVALTAKDGKQFNCMINGGNWLSMGLTNAPACSRKGQPIPPLSPLAR